MLELGIKNEDAEYLERHSINRQFPSYKSELQRTATDAKGNELINNKNSVSFEECDSSTSMSAINTPIAGNVTNDTQFFTQENEPLTQLHRPAEKHNVVKSGTNDTQSITEENEPLTQLHRPAEKHNVDKSGTNDTRSIAQENEPSTQLQRPTEKHNVDKSGTNDTRSITQENEPSKQLQRPTEKHNVDKSGTNDTQSITQENESLTQLHRPAEKHNVDKSGTNDTQTFTQENEPLTQLYRPAEKHNVDKSGTNDTQSITQENEPMMQLHRPAEKHNVNKSGTNHLTSSEEEAIDAENQERKCIIDDTEGINSSNNVIHMPPECTEQGSFSGNLNRENSDESNVTAETSSMSQNLVTDNSQLLASTVCDFGFDHYAMCGSDEFKTLEEALKHFNLYSRLVKLDIILEDVRRRQKTENDYKECFKQFDKEITKLSLICHPDTAQRRGGTENEMKTAQKLQRTLNTMRKVLSYLNAAFLADIHTDHKFQFYSKLNICSLFSEKEIKCRIYEMRFKLSTISKIKQQNIILQIRYFLIKSKKCVSTFLQDKKDEFKNLRDSAFFHLYKCIQGFKTLSAELECMEKKCTVLNDEHVLSFVQSLKKDVKRDMEILDRLEKSVTSSMQGNFEFFSTYEDIDPYFVLPLVWYTNVIVMCKIMSKRVLPSDKLKFLINYFKRAYYPDFNELYQLEPLYYLTAYCSGRKRYENKVRNIMNDQNFCLNWGNAEGCKAEILSKFREILSSINEVAESKFNADHYAVVMTGDFFASEIEKCMLMMNEFHEKEQELSESLKEIGTQTGEMKENYDHIVKTSENLDSKIEQMVDCNSKIEAKFESSRSKIEELIEMSKKLPKNFQ